MAHIFECESLPMYKMEELKIMEELAFSINSNIKVTIIINCFNLIDGQCTASLHSTVHLGCLDVSSIKDTSKYWGGMI